MIDVIVATFLVSGTMAAVFNNVGDSGAQVAEAASRVNRQVDDTQDAFTDIKNLIPEEERLEAAAPGSVHQEPASGCNDETECRSLSSPGGPPMLPCGGVNSLPGGGDDSTVTRGITPAGDGQPEAPEPSDENADPDDRNPVEEAIQPTLILTGRFAWSRARKS